VTIYRPNATGDTAVSGNDGASSFEVKAATHHVTLTGGPDGGNHFTIDPSARRADYDLVGRGERDTFNVPFFAFINEPQHRVNITGAQDDVVNLTAPAPQSSVQTGDYGLGDGVATFRATLRHQSSFFFGSDQVTFRGVTDVVLNTAADFS